MSDGERQFIEELKQKLRHHQEQQEIILEYEHHIYEMKQELHDCEILSYKKITHRLATPSSIAKMWQAEIETTPNKMQWLFVILNIMIFVFGVILTIAYHLFNFSIVDKLWNMLTQGPFIILSVYLLFWGLLGYEIGREFGHRGKRLLQRTFLICIIPNVVFMYVVVFKVIPYEWFDPLLNTPFIIVCIVFTCFLYPICIVGYKWGKKDSV